MKRWFDRNDLWNKPNFRIFPKRTSGRKLSFESTAPKNWFRRKLKELVHKVGLDKACYSTHSLRAGGATDLFVARVPYYVIKKMGRWKSDAAIEYFRNEDDVEAEIFQAFKNLMSAK